MTRAMDEAGALRTDPPLVDGEFHFTLKDFRAIAAMLHGDSGIDLHESKATLVYSRLAKRLRSLGLESFRDYCALIAGEGGADERLKMLAALTTNVTRFFREPHHFEHLKAKVLPRLVEVARAGGRVRIWSAACSSGQEPFSIALTLLEVFPDALRFDVKILASDIDPDMIARGREGVYEAAALADVPGPLRDRGFEPAPGLGSDKCFRARQDLQDLIGFRVLNLIRDWPMRGRFDAIFCRNAVIYFNEETQAQVWSRFVPALEPAGVLYVGHSERVTGAAAAALVPCGVTTYRLGAGGRR